MELAALVRGFDSGDGAPLSVATWNCQSVFMYMFESRGRAQNKFRELQRLVRDHSVVYLQETHGELGDLDTLHRVFPDCLAVASFGNHLGVGGVAIIYKKYLHKVYSVAAPVVVEQGGCIILQLSGPSGFVYLANIHINPNHPPNTKISLISDTLSQLPKSMDSLVILGVISTSRVRTTTAWTSCMARRSPPTRPKLSSSSTRPVAMSRACSPAALGWRWKSEMKGIR